MPFYIVPPRLTTASVPGQRVVTTFNGLTGDIVLSVVNPLQITVLGQTVSLSVAPNHFVLRAGDTMTGNLIFAPTGNGFGLGLYAANNAAEPNPANAVTGAIYFNTTDNELRVFHSGAWHPVGGGGGLSEAAADLRYLKLDGSNDPMTGDLNLGTSLLRLGNKSGAPAGGSAGDVYYDTTQHKVYVYQGSPASWQALATGSAGVETITAGSRITLTAPDLSPLAALNAANPQGTINVNLAADFAWTGNHSFTQPIAFASGQTFDAAKLTIASQASGDLLRFSSGAWGRLPVGTPGQFLVVNNSNLPVWGDGGTAQIGTPPDTSYADGFFTGWTQTTTIAKALDDINLLLSQIAPARPTSLSGQTLTQTGITTYSARLPNGLSTAWYQQGASAGSTVTTYFVSGTVTLTSPSASTTFWVGTASTPSTYGSLVHRRTYYDGSNLITIDHATRDLTTGTTGTTGTVTLIAFNTHNTIWTRAEARIVYTQTTEGYMGHAMHSSTSGTSARRDYWFDDVNTAPAFTANPDAGGASVASAAENSVVNKWLSGVQYYGQNSSFFVSFVAASGIFRKAYHPTNVAQITGTGMSALAVNPSVTPSVNDTFDRSGGNRVAVTLATANQASMNKYLTVTLYKPNGATATSNATLNRAINTYPSNHSTTTAEYFFDEGRRLQSGVNTAFDSTITPVAAGYAQVRNGTLQYPVSADYSGSPVFTGVRTYERKFTKASASNGTLQFTGTAIALARSFAHGDISAYGTGDLNMILVLENIDGVTKKYYDLGKAVGSTPGADGLSLATAIGGKNTGSSSGGNVAWSTGVDSTGAAGVGNNAEFRLVIYLRSDAKFSFTQIVST